MQAFAHVADLEMADGDDDRAPGGAITTALCGSYDHAPPCPLAPHHTDVRRDGAAVSLRILFACQPADEATVRSLIGSALSEGAGTGPDGAASHWRVNREGPAEIRPDEHDHADRLATEVPPA